jgi:hypothetical protein
MTTSAHLLIDIIFDGIEKKLFQKDPRDIKKLSYNTRPLGPLLPRQCYSTGRR